MSFGLATPPATNAARTPPDDALAAIGGVRLAMVACRFPPYVGGVELHTAEVARRLAAAGALVTVLTTDPSGKLPAREFTPEGIEIRRVPAWPRVGPLGDLHIAPALGTLIRRERRRWDLVHLQGYFTFVAPIALRATRATGLPYIISFHSGGHSSPLRNMQRGAQFAALRPYFTGARRLIAVSRFEADYFRARLRLPAERFTVIPNGVTLPVLPADDPVVPTTGPLLVSTGRLERFKGHQAVIAALPYVLDREPTARLRIVGTGPYEAELRRLAAASGVGERIEIAGIPPDDRLAMARLLRSAALVISLSRFESQGIGVGEAIALGRPTLVTADTALAELVEQGLAHGLAPDSTPQQAAAAILGALHARLQQMVATLPTWDDCAAGLARTYRTVLDSAAGER